LVVLGPYKTAINNNCISLFFTAGPHRVVVYYWRT